MPREIQRERKGRQRERGTERRHRRLRKKQGPPPLFPPPPLFLPRFPHSMERIRGFFFALLGIFAVLSLAAARPAASEEAAGRLSKNDDAVGFGSAPIVNRSLRRLRASAAPAPRRALLDVMPWDTVVDQPGSVATTVREREEKSDKANAELRSETSARGGRERRGSRSRAARERRLLVLREREKGIDRRERVCTLKTSSSRDLVPPFYSSERKLTMLLMQREGEERGKGQEDGP